MKGKKGEKPNILLVCVDALRADALGGSDGNPVWRRVGPPSTPAIDSFAGSSMRFRNAAASSSWTKPSLPSIFLSLHPSEHGILETAKRDSGAASSPPVPADVRTLAEALGAEGYRTIGLTHNAQVEAIEGFNRGFSFFSGSAGDGDSILQALRSMDPFSGPSPVFAYVHYLEPHWPYSRRIASRVEKEAAGRFPFHRFGGNEWKNFKNEMKKGLVVPTADEIGFLHRAYGAAVEEADRVVGNLLEWLDEQGALQNSLVLFTADHGEELLDHGSVGHGQSLYEELVHVPFCLRFPEGRELPAGNGSYLAPRDLLTPVSHVDIVPTFLGALGLPAPEDAAGRNLLASGQDGGGDGWAFSEVKHKRRYRQAVRGARYKLIRTYVFEKERAGERGAETEDYNNLDDLFARRPHRIEREIYDLEEDPRESRNLLMLRPDLLTALEGELDAWWRTLRRFGSGRVYDVDTDVIRRLEALGYM